MEDVELYIKTGDSPHNELILDYGLHSSEAWCRSIPNLDGSGCRQ